MQIYKATRSDGTDFHTGTINYAQQLGQVIEITDFDLPEVGSCGKGIHVSPTAKQTIQFCNRSMRPWRFFEGTIEEVDIIAQDKNKLRVKRVKLLKELTLEDIFGKDVGFRVNEAQEEAKTWKDIPWEDVPVLATEEKIKELVGKWREGMKPWLKGKILSDKIKIIND